MNVRILFALVALPCALLLVGCGDEPAPKPRVTAPPAGAAAVSQPVASFAAAKDEPDALSVVDAKERAAGEELAVYGRVSDIADGFAAFTLVDEDLEYCGQGSLEDDHCATPWDYCCIQRETVAAATLPVEFRDAKGEPVESRSLGLRRLDLVSVRGRLEKTESGGLMLVTNSGWFRRERPEVGAHVVWPE